MGRHGRLLVLSPADDLKMTQCMYCMPSNHNQSEKKLVIIKNEICNRMIRRLIIDSVADMMNVGLGNNEAPA